MNPRNYGGNFVWLISILVCIWFLYLIYKLAQLAGAWPFA